MIRTVTQTLPRPHNTVTHNFDPSLLDNIFRPPLHGTHSHRHEPPTTPTCRKRLAHTKAALHNRGQLHRLRRERPSGLTLSPELQNHPRGFHVDPYVATLEE
jgi:hypothetical protein